MTEFIVVTLVHEIELTHSEYHFMLCKCNRVLKAFVGVSDKVGEYCESCNRVYDVWYNGRVQPMPVHESTTVDPSGGIHSCRAPVLVDPK